MRCLVACMLLVCCAGWAGEPKAEPVELSNERGGGKAAEQPIEVSVEARERPAPEIKTVSKVKETKTDAPLNIARICRDLVCEDLGDQEWEKFIVKATQRYKQFEEEYDISNVKRFLDDKLITLAPRLLSGKGAALKEFCCWIALYDVYVEPVPHYIQSISETDKQWIKDELADFDWGRTAAKIKDKAKGSE